jgi:hypothetical protein
LSQSDFNRKLAKRIATANELAADLDKEES